MCVAERIARSIPAEWNSFEHHDPTATCLLHYTDMNTQPWVTTRNPLGHLWVACLRRALDTGFISCDELHREVNAHRVRPSLLPQMASTQDDPRSLPRSMRQMDRGFTAPYRRLPVARWRSWMWLMALAHRCMY